MNRSAFITGGAKRLGRQIALHLAGKGYDLALIYNSATPRDIQETSEVLKKKKVRFRFYKCDLRNLNSVKKTVNKAAADFKKFNLLINNSGVIKKIEFEKITPALFDDTVAVNMRAPFFVTQYLHKYLLKSNEPLVINIASLGGMQNWSGFIPYSLSKTGTIKLTYLLAKALAPAIRVNAIAPGTIIIEGEEAGTPSKIDVSKIPLKKYGSPADILNAIDFIIKDKYITGQVIAVDGGRLLNH